MKEPTKPGDTQAQKPATPTWPELVAMVLTKQKSAAAIVREYEVPRWKLYYELKKQRDRGKPAVKGQELMPLRIKPTKSRAPIELQLSNGHRLIVPADFDEGTLRRLMGVLVGC